MADIIRKEVLWNVAQRVKSSIDRIDALGGLVQGRIDVPMSIMEPVHKYSSVKWIIHYAGDLPVEEATTHEQFNRLLGATPIVTADTTMATLWFAHPNDDGVLFIEVEKTLKDGDPDPEPENRPIISASLQAHSGGLNLIAYNDQWIDVGNGENIMGLAQYAPQWFAEGVWNHTNADHWAYTMTNAIRMATPAQLEGLAAAIKGLLDQYYPAS